MAGSGGRLAFKLLTTLVAIPIGRLVTKGTAKAWVAVRPENPPHDPKRVETTWKDALVWAVVTGFGSAIAQLLTTKGADTAWRGITGRPSPRPKPPKAKKAKGSKGSKGNAKTDGTTIAD
ncbi:MAG TPA: DUF4235 domain-containing protein [Jatrophihabitans sp.]